MTLTGLGNASVRLDAAGQVLFFDPYEPEAPQPPEVKSARRAALLEARHIFITHGHFDHLGSVCDLYRDREVTVWCTATPARTLARRGFPREKVRILAPGDRVELGDVRITPRRTDHCRFDAGEIKNVVLHHRMFSRLGRMAHLLCQMARYPAGRECLLYEIEAEGRRVQLLGSAGLCREADYPAGADVLVLPYQGRSDMAAYALAIAGRLAPKRILLDHFDDAFPPMTCREDTGPFLRAAAELWPGLPCGELTEGEGVTL